MKSPNLVIKYRNEKILDMELSFLTGGPVYARNFKKSEPEKRMVMDREPENYRKFILDFLSKPNICARFNIVRQYDFTVRGSTIVKPFTGMPNRETHSDATIIKPLENSFQGLCITSGSKPEMVGIDAYNGTMHTLFEGYKNILSSGGMPHSVVDALNFGNPENPETMYKFIETLRAISDFCRNTGLPLVSGNVSFYNEAAKEILPTPNILILGKIQDIRDARTVEIKKAGNSLYLAGTIIPSLAGSQYSSEMGTLHTVLPEASIKDLLALRDGISRSMEYIESMHDISGGGLIVALLEMAFGSHSGMDVDLTEIPGRTNEKLFSELGTGMIIEVSPEYEEKFLKYFSGVQLKKIGHTAHEGIRIKEKGRYILSESTDSLRHLWETGLDKYI